jgi:hypothetical protein
MGYFMGCPDGSCLLVFNKTGLPASLFGKTFTYCFAGPNRRKVVAYIGQIQVAYVLIMLLFGTCPYIWIFSRLFGHTQRALSLQQGTVHSANTKQNKCSRSYCNQ